MEQNNELVPSKETIHKFIMGSPSPALENDDLGDSVGILPEEEHVSQHSPGEATTILNDSASSVLEFGSHHFDSTVLDTQLPEHSSPTASERLHTHKLPGTQYDRHDTSSASADMRSQSAIENERSVGLRA